MSSKMALAAAAIPACANAGSDSSCSTYMVKGRSTDSDASQLAGLSAVGAELVAHNAARSGLAGRLPRGQCTLLTLCCACSVLLRLPTCLMSSGSHESSGSGYTMASVTMSAAEMVPLPDRQQHVDGVCI